MKVDCIAPATGESVTSSRRFLHIVSPPRMGQSPATSWKEPLFRKPQSLENTIMNIVLWVLQILLAVIFLAHGWIFLFPPASMVEMMNATLSPAFRLFLGVAEVAAAIGLIVPGITRIQPWLISAAAAGLMVVMLSATVLHTNRGESSSATITTLLLVMAGCVAYMRWKVTPIPPRRRA
jgi:uncharacterized membrane protein YphA (DoxX/SURF4 family)